VFGLETAVGECLRLLNNVSIWIWVAPAVAWAAYAFAMHRRSWHTPVARIAREQAAALAIAGTVVLLLAIPAHVLTVRRGGFIVGIGTALGVIIAVLTILLALGQLLFTLIFPGERGRDEPARP
jgi:protein-S-isoprenylcysteine O-methyltransferase Ste14